MRAIRLGLSTLLLAGCAAEQGGGMNGADLFLNYCAACHGPSGEGDGPVAAVMQVRVPNLRLLSERNEGVFPFDEVREYVDGRNVVSAHGDRRMPIWGNVFVWGEADDPETQEAVEQRIEAVVDFVAGMQY